MASGEQSTDDLVARLRREGRVYTHMEAAAEIERLREECAAQARLISDLDRKLKEISGE